VCSGGKLRKSSQVLYRSDQGKYFFCPHLSKIRLKCSAFNLMLKSKAVLWWSTWWISIVARQQLLYFSVASNCIANVNYTSMCFEIKAEVCSVWLSIYPHRCLKFTSFDSCKMFVFFISIWKCETNSPFSNLLCTLDWVIIKTAFHIIVAFCWKDWLFSKKDRHNESEWYDPSSFGLCLTRKCCNLITRKASFILNQFVFLGIPTHLEETYEHAHE